MGLVKLPDSRFDLFQNCGSGGSGRPYQIPDVQKDDVIVKVPIADEFKKLADAGRIDPDDDSYKDFTRLEVSCSNKVNKEIEKWPESVRNELLADVNAVLERYKYRYSVQQMREDLRLNVMMELMKPRYCAD